VTKWVQSRTGTGREGFANSEKTGMVGERVPIPQPDGSPIDVIVTEVTESKVTLDFNHPFAGQDLTIDIQLLDII
jgi:FKBP-type peptidyl-prolyl cis-trans isomerase 2